jgi:manganese transport protein
VYELVISKPAVNELLGGLIPQKEIIQNPAMLYIAIGILGATVMPHNLYLHSSIVQTGITSVHEKVKRGYQICNFRQYGFFNACFFINAAILILAAATFHITGNKHVADIHDAYKMLTPILGASMASIAFAIAFLLPDKILRLPELLPDRL